MLIYGGLNDRGQPLSDTWLYDRVSNRYQFLEDAGTPTPRHGFGIAYSPTLDQVVIQGGQTNSMSQPGLRDTRSESGRSATPALVTLFTSIQNSARA